MKRRVVVTGIGMVTPLGEDRESSWAAACAGARAVRRLALGAGESRVTALGAPAVCRAFRRQPAQERLPALVLAGPRGPDAPEPPAPDVARWADASHAPVGWAGEMGDAPDRPSVLADCAAEEAMIDAGLFKRTLDDPDPRFGCAVGVSKGSLDRATQALSQQDLTGIIDPRLWEGFFPSSVATQLAARYHLGGPSHCPVSACATGLFAVTQGANWIADGRCDQVLCGSVDASLTPLLLASYRRMGVLAPVESEAPAEAVRPFCATRNGFAVGEGAALFVLEEAQQAQRRGARTYAELAGWMCAADANAITDLSDQPDSLVRCIQETVERSGIALQEVGHVNCHGTATRQNDAWETRGLRAAFGAHADQLRLTANKSMMGHLLGASGSVELALTILALRDQFVPPTVNLRRPDPACDLDYTPSRGVGAPIFAALKQSIGFGGHIATAIVKQCRGARTG